MADQSQLPTGAVLAHTQWGEPKGDTSMVSALGAELAPNTAPYKPPKALPAPNRDKKCKAKNDTCNGWRIRDSDFCAAHAGVFHP